MPAVTLMPNSCHLFSRSGVDMWPFSCWKLKTQRSTQESKRKVKIKKRVRIIFVGVTVPAGIKSLNHWGKDRNKWRRRFSFLYFGASCFTASSKWSWRRTSIPCYCFSSTSWSGSTPSSPSCHLASSAGSPDLMGSFMARRRSEPRESRPVRCWVAQRDPTEQWVPSRGLGQHSNQERTRWIRCLNTQPWHSPTETVSVQGRSSVKRMSDRPMGKCLRRYKHLNDEGNWVNQY